ncbi:hypothetical protein Ancab_030400 [Ancistrocladus abbreviatus]
MQTYKCMAENPISVVKDAVHKLQLYLLEGINDENQLFAAGSLMTRGDYQDVVIERSISNMCGYPLCNNPLPSERPQRGRYRISLKEHKVYDLHETYMYCSTSCVINSRAFAGSLQEERCFTLDTAKIDGILKMFKNMSLMSEKDLGKNGDLGLSELKIQEKTDINGGDVSLEEWIGPHNAIEGYIPERDHNYRLSNSKTSEKGYEPCYGNDSEDSKVDFNSTKLSQVGHTDSKKLPENPVSVMPLQSKALKKGSKQQKSGPIKGKDAILNDVDFMSTIITQDECSISEAPVVPVETVPKQKSKGSKGKLNRKDPRVQSTMLTESRASHPKLELMNSDAAQSGSVKPDKPLAKESLHHNQNGHCENGVDPMDEIHAGNAIQLSKTLIKSSIKSSGMRKAGCTVSWADKKNNGVAGRDLCEFQELKNTKEGSETLNSIEAEDDSDLDRRASAKACAMALNQAAEAVASGLSDVTDAVSDAGIILLPRQHDTNGRKCLDEASTLEAESDPVKWPRKPGLSNGDLFDSEDSWLDAPPEGFSLTLSPFATMLNALFAWITSSSLAYIYGREESFHEDYLSVNGVEYPQKIVLADGRSSEIKQTLAGCLAQALPSVAADLNIPMPISTLEKGLGHLLGTMSFCDALPSFKVKQWQVIVLLFIDALSVCHIPGLAPHLTSKRMLIPKLLEGSQISPEEFEFLKDFILPLGQVPQLPTGSG